MRPANVTARHLSRHPFGRPRTFGPPRAGGPKDCGTVETIYESLPDGARIRIPYELEDGDLALLAAGAPVWLTIWGAGMPPVGLAVGEPAPTEQR